MQLEILKLSKILMTCAHGMTYCILLSHQSHPTHHALQRKGRHIGKLSLIM
jgi:hypothetical protein